MDALPFAAVLLSALLHAGWNAGARNFERPGDALSAGVIASGFISVPLLIYAGLPAPASWPWLAFGCVINSIGIRLAMLAYTHGSFGIAYPVMRAGIPLITLPISMLMFGEAPSLGGAAGVLLISTAIVLLAFVAHAAGRDETKGLIYSLLAAVCGAGYVLADAGGVRQSGNFLAYAACVALGNALIIAAFGALEGKSPVRLMARTWRIGFTLSAASMTSFLLYIWAVTVSPIALAAALRETSVVFATLIAAFILKEHIRPLHWAAAGLALAGVVAIRLG